MITLIAPTNEKKNWKSKEALGACCLKCKEHISHNSLDANTVNQYIKNNHKELLMKPMKNQQGNDKIMTTIHDRFVSVPKEDLKPSPPEDQNMGESLSLKWTAM